MIWQLAIKKKKDNNKIKSYGCSPVSGLKIRIEETTLLLFSEHFHVSHLHQLMSTHKFI